MANPQLENGHTKIANEILEHLYNRYLSPNQWQIVICIIRKTYGYHKKVDYIANSQIMQETGLCKTVVSRALKALINMQIIIRDGKNIGIQKDWELWGKLAIQSTKKLAAQITKVDSTANKNTDEKLADTQQELAEQLTEVSSADNKKLAEQITTKERKKLIQKILIQKKVYGEFQNVLLTDEEYQKLKQRFNSSLKDKIEELSSAIASKNYKYSSHYAVIINWFNRDNKQNTPKGAAHGKFDSSPKPHDQYTDPEQYIKSHRSG